MSALGRLAVNLSLDSAEFSSGLTDAERKAAQTMRAIEGSIEAARAGFASFVAASAAAGAVLVQLADGASQYQDVADKIGDAASEVAALKTAADVAGYSLDSMGGLVNKLSAALAKSDDESRGAREALKAIGIDLKAFEQLSSVQRIEALARAFSELEDGPKKSALAIAALGKSGADALPFFNDYIEIGRSQYAITQDQIAAADALTNQINKLKSETTQLAQATAGDLSPALSQAVRLLDVSLQYYRDGQVGSTALSAALGGLRTVMETILVVGSDVAFVFKMVGMEIGGMAAQVAALMRGDFKGFSAISDAMKEDAKRARAELDAFQASILRGPVQAELWGGEARLGRSTRREAPSLPSAGGRGGAARSGLTDAQKEAQELGKLIDSLNAKSSGFDGSFYKNFDLLNDALDQGKLSLTEFNRLQSQLISQQPGMQAAAQKEIELARGRNAEFDVYFAQVERDQALVEGRIRSSREMLEGIQFETSLIGLSNIERQKAVALKQLENAGVKQGTEAYAAYATQIKNALDIQSQSQKAQQEFEGLSNSITQALRGNGDAVKQMMDQIINEFLRLQIVEPILKSIMGGSGGGIGGGIGSFLGSLFSFEGGGSTGNGPRSGGVDGKGGFPVIVHPKERIVDLTKGQSAGGGSTIIINNTIGSVASQEDVVRGMSVVRQQIRGDMGRSVRFGGALA
jgi:hypothetical protein